ncbi:hypothetical protein [Streptomyces sp. NPDC047079]
MLVALDTTAATGPLLSLVDVRHPRAAAPPLPASEELSHDEA